MDVIRKFGAYQISCAGIFIHNSSVSYYQSFVEYTLQKIIKYRKKVVNYIYLKCLHL